MILRKIIKFECMYCGHGFERFCWNQTDVSNVSCPICKEFRQIKMFEDGRKDLYYGLEDVGKDHLNKGVNGGSGDS